MAHENKDYHIYPGLEISMVQPQANATVLQPFIIIVVPDEEGYIATSHISTVYELEPTANQAVGSYLRSLIDELVWLKQEQESLSPAIQEELRLLQSYLQITDLGDRGSIKK